MVYRASVAGRTRFPASLEGRLVVLRRHVPENLAAFRRWYRDAEVARLARYQDGPMSIEEIDRFFQARALGDESMTMAIHVRGSDRLIGTCAFSQLDGDNGSALYHITIGEKDAWGHGYGTEATRLMVGHALGTLGLHRIALVGLRVQRAGDPRLRRLRVQHRGSRPGGDLARRAVVGRDLDEHPRARVAATAGVGGAARRREPGAGRHRGTHPGEVTMASTGPAADAARAAFRERMEAKGHAVELAREAVAGLEAAFADGALQRTPLLDQMLADLMVALEQDEGQKLGGKSAEAARFIVRAISRELDNA